MVDDIQTTASSKKKQAAKKRKHDEPSETEQSDGTLFGMPINFSLAHF